MVVLNSLFTEMFRLFADNNQCKHIFFAGCHDTGYLSLLTPYRGKSDRITLLRAAGFHAEFERLGLPIKELPEVFPSHNLMAPTTTPIPTQPAAQSRPVCKHFQKVCPNTSRRTSWTNQRPGYLPIRERVQQAPRPI